MIGQGVREWHAQADQPRLGNPGTPWTHHDALGAGLVLVLLAGTGALVLGGNPPNSDTFLACQSTAQNRYLSARPPGSPCPAYTVPVT